MLRIYRGKEMAPLLERIKTELGEEAVIIASSTIRVEGEKVIEIRASRGASNPDPKQEASADKGVPQVKKANPIAATKGLLPGLPTGMNSKLAALTAQHPHAATVIEAAIQQGVAFDGRLPAGQRIMTFVGAPGSGKTTLIAKLAAAIARVSDLRIGLISADGSTVAGGLKLQTYASLLGVQYQLVQAQGLMPAIASMAECDVVLIDAPGVNARNPGQLQALEHSLIPPGESERILVMSAATNEVDQRAGLAAFQRIGAQRVVLTKLDETAEPSRAVGAVAAAKMPLSFLSLGARVPEDIEVASPKRLAWFLLQQLQATNIVQ